MVTDWPGAEGINEPKVPTFVQYEETSGRVLAWRYELSYSSFTDGAEDIKLLLDPGHSVPFYVPPSDTQAKLQRLGKPAIRVAADYIETLYKYALSKIGATRKGRDLSMLQKKFVLSVPAFWPDRAKDGLMRVCTYTPSDT